MIDDFMVRALAAGIGVALVAGPLGCFVVWRRMAYFGDTVAHSTLFAVAVGLILHVDLMLAAFVVAIAVALALLALQRTGAGSADTILGILSHGTLALGLVVVAVAGTVRIDLMGYLFGDILAVSLRDISVIWVGGAAALAVLVAIWRPLLAATVSPEIAGAEAMHPGRARLVFLVLIAALVALAMKIVGILLITALLIIPPAAARGLTRGPEAMAVAAALVGAVAVVAGLGGSLAFDTPSGPSIVVAALVLFLASLALGPWLLSLNPPRTARSGDKP